MPSLYDSMGAGYSAGRREDPHIAGMSGFAQAPRANYEEGLAPLAADLSGGTWQRSYAALVECEIMDFGYRLIVAGSPCP